MAEKEQEEKETLGEEKKKSGNLVLIIIIVVLVLILAIGGIIAAMMMGNHDAEVQSGTHQEAAPAQHGGDEGHAPAEGNSYSKVSTEVGMMYPLDIFTVNLLSESGRRYLKVELNLEIEGKELALELDAKKPLLRDIIIRLLTSKSLEEISTVKGKEKLKEQIVGEINTRIKDGKILNVYFTDFVIQ